VRGLGKWADAVQRAGKCSRLKAQKKSPSGEKSLLSEKGPASGPGESAAVHHAHASLLEFSDKVKKGDKDPTVVKTVVDLAVAGSDDLDKQQEKEVRSVGGIPSR